MGYFQTTNPWMSFAEAGRGVGSALGQYLTELPRLRAEVAIQAQREPQRLAMQAAQIEGQGIENALGREKVANRGLYRQLLEGQVNDLGLHHQGLMAKVEADKQAQLEHKAQLDAFTQQQSRDAGFRLKMLEGAGGQFDNLLNTEQPMQFGQPMPFTPRQSIEQGAQMGASRAALSPYEMLFLHGRDADLDTARLANLQAETRLRGVQSENYGSKAFGPTDVPELGHWYNILRTSQDNGTILDQDMYDMARRNILRLEGVLKMKAPGAAFAPRPSGTNAVGGGAFRYDPASRTLIPK